MKKLYVLVFLFQSLGVHAGHMSNSDFDDLINGGCPIDTVYRVYNSISQTQRDKRSSSELKAIVKELCDDPDTIIDGIKANLQTPEICGGPCASGPLKIDGHLALHILGHTNLDKHLSKATFLGEGEFGRVYNLDNSGVIIKIQKEENASLAPELEYTECLAKHLPSLNVDVLATVPITKVQLELEGGRDVNALLKARVFGNTLLSLSRTSKEFPTVKKALETFIEAWIHHLASRDAPDFHLTDFKMSNLMWGRTAGQEDDHLILIDINCFDDPTTLSKSFPDMPAENKLEYFANQVFHGFVGGTMFDRKWSSDFGNFHFRDSAIQKVYEQRLSDAEKRKELIALTKKKEAEREKERLMKLEFCKADFIAAKQAEIREIQERAKAGKEAGTLSPAQLEELQNLVRLKRTEIKLGMPIECPK